MFLREQVEGITQAGGDDSDTKEHHDGMGVHLVEYVGIYIFLNQKQDGVMAQVSGFMPSISWSICTLNA